MLDEKVYVFKSGTEGNSWWSSDQDSLLSLPKARVSSVVGEVRSHKLQKKEKKKSGTHISNLLSRKGLSIYIFKNCARTHILTYPK